MNTYKFNLTEAEIRMILTALDNEADKRAKAKDKRAEEFESLTERFLTAFLEVKNGNI